MGERRFDPARAIEWESVLMGCSSAGAMPMGGGNAGGDGGGECTLSLLGLRMFEG